MLKIDCCVLFHKFIVKFNMLYSINNINTEDKDRMIFELKKKYKVNNIKELKNTDKYRREDAPFSLDIFKNSQTHRLDIIIMAVKK